MHMKHSSPTSASTFSTFDRLTDSSQRTSQVYTPPPFTNDNRSNEQQGEREGFNPAGDDRVSEREEEHVVTPDLYRIAAVAGLGGESSVLSGSLPYY